MKIEYIKEIIESDYDGIDENIKYYYEFFCDSSLEYLLIIHLNRDYGDFGYDEFKSLERFPKNSFRDIYNVILNVLNNLEEELFFYYNKSEVILVNRNIISDYQRNSVNIKIQFDCGNCFSHKEALKKIRTLYLHLIPKNILFQFIKSVIFESNYRTTPGEYLLKQKDELEDTINFSAFIYFMQCNLLKIEMNDLEKAQKDLIGLNIRINPFFDQQIKVVMEIAKIFKNFKSMTIREGKYITRKERLKRIFDVYLMIQYPTIYFESTSEKITDTMIFKELRRLGYVFSEFDCSNDVVTSAEVSANRSHITNDKNIIEKIRKMNLV